MKPQDIIDNLTASDLLHLAACGFDEWYVIGVLEGEYPNDILLKQAEQLAVMRKYGVNSKEYAELIEPEGKFVRRQSR